MKSFCLLFRAVQYILAYNCLLLVQMCNIQSPSEAFSLTSVPPPQPRSWRSCPGGTACFYRHFGGAKALFFYNNLQVADYVGGAKPYNFFYLGAMLPVPPEGTFLSRPHLVRLSTGLGKRWGSRQ